MSREQMETTSAFIDPPEDYSHSQLNDQTSMIQLRDCLTDQTLLNLFENRELVTYYVGLKEALSQWRCTDEPCLCDPRDTDMRLRLGQWRPQIVLKLAHEQKSSASAGLELANKQLALVEVKQGEDLGEESTVTASGSRSTASRESQSFLCGLSGCKQVFQSLASYESHYHTCHNFVCSQCKSSLVSSFLLDVHLQENHDSYFQVLSLRSDMYRCLVECCDLKFKTPDLRRDHMVQVHKLPANFMFHKPIKTKPKKSRLKAKSAHRKDSMDTSDTIVSTLSSTVEDAMEDSISVRSAPAHASGRVTSAGASKDCRYKKLRSKPTTSDSESRLVDPVSEPSLCPYTLPGSQTLVSETESQLSSETVAAMETSEQSPRHKVPPVICFGRGSQKTFRNPRRPHWHQTGVTSMDTTVNIENVDLSQLVDSLS